MVRREYLKSNSCGTYPVGKYAYFRLSCIFVDHFLGKKFEDVGARLSEPLGSHRERCDALLSGHIHLPFGARDDPDFWPGESYRFAPQTEADLIQCVYLGIVGTCHSSVSRH